MLSYMRPEPKGTGPSSPGRNSQSAPPHPQQPPPPLASRQPLAEAAKVPLPRTGRFATSGQPPTSLPAGSPPSQTQPHAMRHARANSDAGRGHAPSEQEQQIWEDSTINSLLGESVSGSARPRAAHGQDPRRLDNTVSQRSRYRERNGSESGELNPFVIQENGLLKVLPVPGNTSTSKPPITRSITDNLAFDDPYAAKSRYESSQKSNHTLKHAKYPFRDARAAKRASVSDHYSHNATAGDTMTSSPERFVNGVQPREPRPEDRAQEYDHHRSTIFHDIDTPGRTPAPPEDDEISEAPSQGDEATNRTPRQSKIPPRQTALPSLPPPLTKQALQESTLPRTGVHREKKMEMTSRKRRLSLDYDDHVLHSMNYTDLRNEEFDHDPARISVQSTNIITSGNSLEEKLAHFKDKDESNQHQFFTQITVKEWDQAGDWFLDQFTSVVQRMKDARQSKRKLVEQFEDEISSREEMVRGKVESIDRTLKDLRQEGEGMMRGKDVDV